MSERVNNSALQTACHHVSLGSGHFPSPLFLRSDFISYRLNDCLRVTPLPFMQRTVFQPRTDWQSDSASVVLEALHDSQTTQAEENPKAAKALKFRRSSGAVEVDASAADLFATVTNPFARQIRIIQCNACRRPLLITRLFQHLSHCPVTSMSTLPTPQPPSLNDDPMLDLVAAAYISPPSSPHRKRPRASSTFPPSVSVGVPEGFLTTSRESFSYPREEDDWQTAFKLAFPVDKPISKYHRRRVYLPAPQNQSSQRKRTLAVERRSLDAAAEATLYSIPARSPTHQHQAYARDPLRNAAMACASTLPWTKLIQAALHVPIPRNPNPRQMLKSNVQSTDAPSFAQKGSVAPSTPTSAPIGRPTSSPVDPTNMHAFPTITTTPSLAGALLYLRGQGLRPLANTPLSSIDAPQLPIARPGDFFHGQPSVEPLGTYHTDPRSVTTKDVVLPTVVIPQPIPTSTNQQPSLPRSIPSDPRTKKISHGPPLTSNQSSISNVVPKTEATEDLQNPSNTNIQQSVTNFTANGHGDDAQVISRDNALPGARVVQAQHPMKDTNSFQHQSQKAIAGTQSSDAPSVDGAPPQSLMPNLPPPSPSPSLTKRPRSSKQRSQSAGPKGLSIGKGASTAERKSGGKSSSSVSSVHGKASGTGNVSKSSQSPASSFLQHSQGEPFSGVPLEASSASSPAFGPHPQQVLQTHNQQFSQVQRPTHPLPYAHPTPLQSQSQSLTQHQQSESLKHHGLELNRSQQTQSTSKSPQQVIASNQTQNPNAQFSQPRHIPRPNHPQQIHQAQSKQLQQLPLAQQIQRQSHIQHHLHGQLPHHLRQQNTFSSPNNVINSTGSKGLLPMPVANSLGDSGGKLPRQTGVMRPNGGENVVSGMRPPSNAVSRASHSPSQASARSGDRPSYNIAPGAAKTYDAILRTAGLSPHSLGANQAGSVQMGRIDDNNLPLDFLSHNHVQAPIMSSGTSREDMVSELRRVMNAGAQAPSYGRENGLTGMPQRGVNVLSSGQQANGNLGAGRGLQDGSFGNSIGPDISAIHGREGGKSSNMQRHLGQAEIHGADLAKDRVSANPLPSNMMEFRKSLEANFLHSGSLPQGAYNLGLTGSVPVTRQVPPGLNSNVQGQPNINLMGGTNGSHGGGSGIGASGALGNNAGVHMLQGHNVESFQNVPVMNGGRGISSSSPSNQILNLFQTPDFRTNVGRNLIGGDFSSDPLGIGTSLMNMGSGGTGGADMSENPLGSSGSAGVSGTGVTAKHGTGGVTADVLLEQMLSGRSGMTGSSIGAGTGLGFNANFALFNGAQSNAHTGGVDSRLKDSSNYAMGQALQGLQARLGTNSFEETDGQQLSFDFDESDFGP